MGIDLINFTQRMMGDRELALQILDVFLAELPEHLRAFEKAMEEGNLHKLARLSHKIKSAAANVCADELKGLLIDLEAAAGQGDANLTKQALGAVRREITLIRAEDWSQS